MIREYRTGSSPVTGTTPNPIYRGVEQLVARRAHNPEVVRFKSHPRNHKTELIQFGFFFLYQEVFEGGLTPI